MSEVSKNELKYDNSVSFPNNNAGAITPSDLRAFNVDLIDSTVNQTLYNTDSASLYWKIEDADSSINSLQIFTASQDDVNATLASTGSNTFVGNQTIEGDVVISYDGVSVTLNASTLNNGLAIDSNLDVYGNITSIGNLDIDGTITASLQTGYVWLGGPNGTVQAVPSASLVTAGTTDVVALNEFTASQQIINSGYNAFTASQQASDTQLNSFTSSQEQKNTTLGSVTASLQGQLTTIGTQSGSWVTESETGSFARVDVSNTFTTDQTIQGTLNVTTLNATTIHTIIESSSVIFSSGSNILGDELSDIQTLSGSVKVVGGLTLNGTGVVVTTDLLPLNSFTASQQILNATYATTGSNQFNGSQSVSGSITLSGSVNNVDYIDFNTASLTPAWKSGRVFWDNTDGALGVYNAEADITLQVGQEQWVKVRNNTGSPIVNGAVVRLVGAQGDNPLVVLAQSVQMSGSVATDNQVLGIATHTIETGTNGYVTTLGNVRGLNTNAYAEGDILWVSSSAGLLTNVVPVAPYERIPVATVVKVGPGGSGIVYVAPIPPIDFASLSSVEISGSYTNGDMWIYEGNVWKHKTISEIGLATTGSNIFNGTQTITGSLLVNGSSTITGSVNGNVVTQGITSTTASLDFSTSNFFELTLVNGANTRVEATNVRKGQTVNVLVKQPVTTGSGTISFSTNFDFPEIAPYTATTGANAKDILTFITFADTSSIYSAGVNNLI